MSVLQTLNSGDILFTFNTSLGGSLRKAITRKSFRACHIYLNLGPGVGKEDSKKLNFKGDPNFNKHMVLTNRGGRLELIHLHEFTKRHKEFTNANALIPSRIMAKVMPLLGTKTPVEMVIHSAIGIGNKEGTATPDEIYKQLTGK